MRAYYIDELPSEQCLLHDSGNVIDDAMLDKLSVLWWHIPVEPSGEWEGKVDAIANERQYRNRNICLVTKEGMGEDFEVTLKWLYHEYVFGLDLLLCVRSAGAR
ncbi:uncharacterized protein LAESUDRAFT_765379 [Laetiporus sulphureus 93-53]|uniref:Uncharacterized protein n=1 Tax=Laetiporus sulphureus 93-53 TaxID=1314785 RepID=A0A165ASL5_9APHY|nr:uncharacterized protein LAESUDRAFT_765379 [Laetiporus sulphureus 93-53]KZS99583.1 hypothetical protein LAESUDRAFT_765379 [Laetiporus sulphureus 93-53]